jgi:hypothetical protein
MSGRMVSKDPTLRQLAESTQGQTILAAHVDEDGAAAWEELHLSDGRTLTIGAHGSLYDEAYLVFGETDPSPSVDPPESIAPRARSPCPHPGDIPASSHCPSRETRAPATAGDPSRTRRSLPGCRQGPGKAAPGHFFRLSGLTCRNRPVYKQCAIRIELWNHSPGPPGWDASYGPRYSLRF